MIYTPTDLLERAIAFVNADGRWDFNAEDVLRSLTHVLEHPGNESPDLLFLRVRTDLIQRLNCRMSTESAMKRAQMDLAMRQHDEYLRKQNSDNWETGDDHNSLS